MALMAAIGASLLRIVLFTVHGLSFLGDVDWTIYTAMSDSF